MTIVGGGSFSQELDIASENLKFFLKKTPCIDKIIIEEGEMLFLKYLREELPQGQRIYSLKDNSNRLMDLSSAELPDFSDFDMQRYPHMAAYSSRSCPFQCSFCAETTYWGKYRKKSAAQVVEEMHYLYNKYGRRLFLMCDSLLNPVIAGLAREFLAEAGIKTTTYWIVGHPGETAEDFQQTLDFITAFKDDIYEAECNPFRYFESGQVDSGKWSRGIERIPLYPGETNELLMNRTLVFKSNPTWEETIERVHRFVLHCDRLGVPNPYTLPAIYEVDEHWKKLHRNAVPSLADLNDKNVDVNESKNVEKIVELQNKLDVDGDFCLE